MADDVAKPEEGDVVQGTEGAVSDAGQVEHLSFCLVELVDVSVALPSQHGQVLLTEVEAPFRSLEFPIGLAEAAALVQAQRSERAARPSTHELFADVLARFTIDVVALRITDKVGGVLHAELDFMGARGREVVPCRPSDGLVLCHRQPVTAPVLVADALLGG